MAFFLFLLPQAPRLVAVFPLKKNGNHKPKLLSICFRNSPTNPTDLAFNVPFGPKK